MILLLIVRHHIPLERQFGERKAMSRINMTKYRIYES